MWIAAREAGRQRCRDGSHSCALTQRLVALSLDEHCTVMPMLGHLTDPFWRSTTMHRESVVFIGQDHDPPVASLLFPPDVILAVSSAAGDAACVEGADYLVGG